MSNFALQWRQFYPEAPPIGHVLRQAAQDRWIRFHSLPSSKRYATTQREKWIVLDRANKLAGRVLGEGSRCWLVQAQPDYGDAANDSDTYGTIVQYGLDFAFEHPAFEDDCAYRIFAAPVIWSAGAFNDLISRRADDALYPTMWVSALTGAVFAPYDGGTDMFVGSADEVALLKREFTEWLSDRADGL